jgi:hypothetical protein
MILGDLGADLRFLRQIWGGFIGRIGGKIFLSGKFCPAMRAIFAVCAVKESGEGTILSSIANFYADALELCHFRQKHVIAFRAQVLIAMI